jgi:hypothetical protein
MSILVQCSECAKKLNAPNSAAGKRVRCPGCKNPIDVPDPEEEIVEPDDEVAIQPESKPAPRRPSRDDEAKGSKKKREQEDEAYETEDEDEDEDDRPRRKKKKRAYDDEGRASRRGRPKETHRGVIILILAIAAILFAWIPIVCWVLAAFAERMANADLAKMDAGKMDRSGHGLTQAGRICAYVGAIISLLWCVSFGFIRSG